MEQDPKNGWLWCSYDLIWSFFEDDVGLEYKEVQSLTREMMEEAFKLNSNYSMKYTKTYIFIHFKGVKRTIF